MLDGSAYSYALEETWNRPLSFGFGSDDRCFEFRCDCDEDCGRIVEVGTGDPPMEFDSAVEILGMWADLKESFGIPLGEEECEIIDALEVPRLPRPGEEL